jgi:hypothetical protein
VHEAAYHGLAALFHDPPVRGTMRGMFAAKLLLALLLQPTACATPDGQTVWLVDQGGNCGAAAWTVCTCGDFEPAPMASVCCKPWGVGCRISWLGEACMVGEVHRCDAPNG